jgi:hypothetical protein
MADGQTTEQRYHQQVAKEHAAFERDELAKRQLELDFWWQIKLARDAERRARARAPDEHPERGEYNPIARYERETRSKYGY